MHAKVSCPYSIHVVSYSMHLPTVISDAVRTTLGPRGMDKLIVDSRHNATISNDGASIMKLLVVVHPAARILVDIAKSQDAEVC